MGSAQHVALSSQFQVSLRQCESIGGGHESLQTLHGVEGIDGGGGEQQAQSWMPPTSDATAELVKLRNSEAVSIQNDHDGGIRDVNADLDDGGGHQHIQFPRRERDHRLVPFSRRLPAVDHSNTQSLQWPLCQHGGDLLDCAEASSILQSSLGLVSGDGRAHHECLPPLGHLLPDALPRPGHPVGITGGVHEDCLDLGTPCGTIPQLDGLQVPEDRHRHRTGDRRGGHHQGMGLLACLGH